MQLTNISVCVLNWENYPDTEKCIAALLALPELRDEDLNVHIVVIDNGSRDDSFLKLSALASGEASSFLSLVRTDENKGYAAGNNKGIVYALENLQPNYVWILNNDTIPQQGSLRALVECAQSDQSVGIWGSTVLNKDGSMQCAGGCYYNSWLGITKPALPKAASTGGPTDLEKPLDYVYGAAMLISTELVKDCGLLNEEYFLYYEELDYAKRINNIKSMRWCSRSEVIHVGSGSLRNDDMEGGVFEYYSILSLLKFTNKYYKFKIPSVLLTLIFVKPILYISRNQINYFSALFLAILNFFNGGMANRFIPGGGIK